MLGLPKERDKATPTFGKKLNLGIFSKFCLHGVAYELERLFKNFSDIFGQPERRGGRRGHANFLKMLEMFASYLL